MLPRTKAEWRERIARVNAEAEADTLPHLPSYPVSVERSGRLAWARPHAVFPAFEGKVILYLHGGGFAYFAGPLVDYWTAAEAVRLPCVHVGVDYRQAPEHTHPAGLRDVTDAYRTLLEQYEPKDIAIFGVSAGGNLAVSLLHQGLPMPACLMLDAPLLDLARDHYDHEPELAALTQATARLYAGETPLSDPGLSPLQPAPTGFPPTFLQAGERDFLLSDTLAFRDKLQAVGVPVSLHLIPGAGHGGFGGNAPADNAARSQRLAFLANAWA